MIAFLAITILAYLLGSVCSAILVCKIAGLPDPRTQGSGNPGASNVLRVAGKTYAAFTLLGDALKGFIPVFLALLFNLPSWSLSLIGLAAVLGHLYPVFFKFQGGKGVATALGVYFALSYPLGLVAIILWVSVAYLSRYASLASLVACTVTPFVSLLFNPAYFIGLLIIDGLIVWRHRGNIARLQQGNETRI